MLVQLFGARKGQAARSVPFDFMKGKQNVAICAS